MDIGRKLINGIIWYWIIAFVGLLGSFAVMGLIHVIKILVYRVWI